MGCDMVTALGRATAEGVTLFGHNSGRPAGEEQALRLLPGRPFEAGEKVRLQRLELPQARQTCTVLGSQPAGAWGFEHGVNGYGVAAGRAPLRTLFACAEPGLLGAELVRLALERTHSARQAVDLLTDLVCRHGQAGDNAFLVADAEEAFAVEACGRHWVVQEVREVRALGPLATVRQDWDRIARGLAEEVIARGWWPGDGSKLDFAGSVCRGLAEQTKGLRRWGRATLLLAEQNGHIDGAFVRRLLGDHYEDCPDEVDPCGGEDGPVPLCRHGGDAVTAASLVAVLQRRDDRLALAWCAFGPPCLSVYFPVFLDGELPAAFSGAGLWQRTDRLLRSLGSDREAWDVARVSLGRLQGRFDQEAEEFAAEGVALRQGGEPAALQRQAGLFVQHCLEQFDEVQAALLARRRTGRGLAVSS